MKKRLFVILCIVANVLMFAMPVMASAAPSVQATSSSKNTFSMDTVITKDNMNAILTYYGLDPSTAKKSDKPSVVTVGDLVAAINAAKEVPKVITTTPNVEVIPNVKATPNTYVTGNKTVFKDSSYSNSLKIRYSASGDYYISTSNAWWTAATGGNIQALGTGIVGFEWDITNISYLNTNVYYAGSNSSYLQDSYYYTCTSYVTVGGGQIQVSQVNISGYTNFPGSTYL